MQKNGSWALKCLTIVSKRNWKIDSFKISFISKNSKSDLKFWGVKNLWKIIEPSRKNNVIKIQN